MQWLWMMEIYEPTKKTSFKTRQTREKQKKGAIVSLQEAVEIYKYKFGKKPTILYMSKETIEIFDSAEILNGFTVEEDYHILYKHIAME